ncbi:MAG: T9SS type A sorting domain-containing protein [Ignavibacteriales bacterium]|nr:T9SS type A sorting domain-containing protein [Ignavibacteriales bacterium]
MAYSKIRLIVFVYIITSVTAFSQEERFLLTPNKPPQKLNNLTNLNEAIKTNLHKTNFVQENLRNNSLDFDINNLIDTLLYNKDFNFNNDFGFFDQDVEFTWFEAPTDMIIKAAGFSCSEIAEGFNGPKISLRLIKLNWSKEQLLSFNTPTYLGYYPDQDNMNNAEPFGENSGNNWIDKSSGQYSSPPWEHTEYDLWSDNKKGYQIIPTANTFSGNYQWVEMSLLENEPLVSRGDIFAVVLSHEGIEWNSTDNRIGIWSKTTTNQYSWKYYENGRFAPEEPGWWAREFTFDFAIIADLLGDVSPEIKSFSKLNTTLSEDPRSIEAIITDKNPSGQQSGVKSAKILYSINEGISWNESEMSGSEPNYFGDIPGFPKGTEIQYKIVAEDVNGLITETEITEYFIFNPSCHKKLLLVFNGYSEPIGYPQSYYFGMGDFTNFGTIDLQDDKWSYGPLTKELVDNYSNIIEITTSGPIYNNNNVIKEWLQNDYANFYMLIGDEYLTYQSDGQNKIYSDGDFLYDVLGITESFNNISIIEQGDETIPSIVLPVENSLLGGELFTLHNTINSENGWTSPIYYNPTYEISGMNYLDGFNIREDTEIDMQAIGKDGNTYNIGSHRTFGNKKIVFLSYDALSISSGDPMQSPPLEYYWYGFTSEAPQVQALQWTIDIGDCFEYDPKITKITNLQFVLENDPIEILATIEDNPCSPNCPNRISEALIEYSVNEGSHNSVSMTEYEPEKYKGFIPEQTSGSTITYRIYAKDEDGKTGNSRYEEITFTVVNKPASKNLVILQNYEGNDSLKILEYFSNNGISIDFDFTIYPESGLTDNQFSYFNNIYNITSYNTEPQNQQEITERIAGILLTQKGKNYFVCGDNFLGSFSSKSTYYYSNWSTNYQLFGLTNSYSSINSKESYDTSQYYFSTKFFAVENSMFGDNYFNLNDKDTLIYIDPNINKIDGFESLSDVSIDFKAKGYDGNIYNVGGHRTLPNGNNVVFMCFDPLSIYKSDGTNTFQNSMKTIPLIAKEWFDLTTDIDDNYEQTLPTEISLRQNYPNPFNPTTTIKYSVPIVETHGNASVQLTVYDVLGRKIKTLVNEVKSPGNYSVTFNASNFPSGVYYYQLQVGDLINTKKMVLLK